MCLAVEFGPEFGKWFAGRRRISVPCKRGASDPWIESEDERGDNGDPQHGVSFENCKQNAKRLNAPVHFLPGIAILFELDRTVSAAVLCNAVCGPSGGLCGCFQEVGSMIVEILGRRRPCLCEGCSDRSRVSRAILGGRVSPSGIARTLNRPSRNRVRPVRSAR